MHLSDEERLAIRDDLRRETRKGLARARSQSDHDIDPWDVKTKPGNGTEIVIHVHTPKDEPQAVEAKQVATEKPVPSAGSIASVIGAVGQLLAGLPAWARVLSLFGVLALVAYVARLYLG